MKRAALTLGLFMGVAWAQQVVDPLRRSEPREGDFSYFASLTYFPTGDSYSGTNEAGEDVFVREALQNFGASLGVSYSVSSELTLSARVSPNFALSTAEVSKGAERIVTSESSAGIGGAVAASYALAQDSELDPTVSLSLSYPFAGSVELGASLIRDPVVINGFLEVAKPFFADGVNLFLGSGVGFIANETVDLRFSNSVGVPVGVVGAPSWSLSLRVGYALNPEGTHEIGLTSYLDVREGVSSLGLGVDFGDTLN